MTNASRDTAGKERKERNFAATLVLCVLKGRCRTNRVGDVLFIDMNLIKGPESFDGLILRSVTAVCLNTYKRGHLECSLKQIYILLGAIDFNGL